MRNLKKEPKLKRSYGDFILVHFTEDYPRVYEVLVKPTFKHVRTHLGNCFKSLFFGLILELIFVLMFLILFVFWVVALLLYSALLLFAVPLVVAFIIILLIRLLS